MFKFSYATPSSTSLPFIDFEVCSGDLQHMNASLCSGATSGMKVERYSAKDRRERIERYRNKRNQRNFRKKITYACRKALADSRPRVRGRFARNDDAELETESSEKGRTCGDWRRKMKAVLMAAGEEDDDDEDLLVGLENALFMNLNCAALS
ncbi:transcription factor GHD7-like [Phalaenopsis equestris]|uniref:transcription factor GHD7-like n=1 Tax=Phalaenopsis equestris TaxID=78828 RepID=UPI0009E31D7A|nr:transcription factor GHD7-like [Phalaenopsis equestris]